MLNWLWRGRSAREPSAAGPVEAIELRHVDGVVAEQVRAFFAGELPEFQKDGRRSVRLVHPVNRRNGIKAARLTPPSRPIFEPPCPINVAEWSWGRQRMTKVPV